METDMKHQAILSVPLAGALLLGASLLTGCNKGQNADTTAADTMPETSQPAPDTGTASTTPTTTPPTDTSGATTMGNAGDTGSDMSSTGNASDTSGTGNASDMSGTGTGTTGDTTGASGTGTNGTSTSGTSATGTPPPQDNDQSGSGQNPPSTP